MKLNLFAPWLLLLLAPALGCFAQQRYTYFSVGAHIGTSHYQGDLDNHGFEPWRKDSKGAFLKGGLIRPCFGFSVNYHFNPHMFFRLAVTQGWIGAADSLKSDSSRIQRNLSFRSSVTEASFQLVYEFFATDRHYKYRPSWSPYVFTGISVYHFNPKAKPNDSWADKYPNVFKKDEWQELKPLGTEGQTLPDAVRAKYDLPSPYRLTQISIPIGIGTRFTLTRKMDLRVEFGLRKTFTDYLDDVSGTYAPPEELLTYEGEKSFLFADRSSYANYGNGRSGMDGTYVDGAYGAPGTIRGNRSDKDWYGFFTIGITYILDRGERCPKHKYY